MISFVKANGNKTKDCIFMQSFLLFIDNVSK